MCVSRVCVCARAKVCTLQRLPFSIQSNVEMHLKKQKNAKVKSSTTSNVGGSK